jgi:hypothetical protein
LFQQVRQVAAGQIGNLFIDFGQAVVYPGLFKIGKEFDHEGSIKEQDYEFQ